jgi:uncharacterized protein
MAQRSHESSEVTAPRPLLLLDPWGTDYDGSIQVDSAEEAAIAGEIDPTIETTEWEAISTSDVSVPELHFVDGVRRTDARVLSLDDGTVVHGLFGTVGAGAVRADGQRATFGECIIRRALIIGSGHCRSETVSVGNMALEFEGIASAATAAAEVGLELQSLMRHTEADLATELLKRSTVLFFDGPLAYVRSPGPVVGLIKTISLPYLDQSHFALVSHLTVGQRTPLFGIRDGRNDRYSWFLRIGNGRHFDHVFAGIIRLEVRAAVGIELARTLAAISASALPRFASSPVRDARAPQNIVPVGALEMELRRRMGDPLMIRRGIEKRISKGVAL